MKMKISRLGISPKVLEEKNVSFYYDEKEKSTTVTVTYRIQYPYYFYSESTQKKIREYIFSLSSSITQSNCGVEGYVTFMTKFKTVCADGDTFDKKIGRDRALDKSRRFAYKVSKEIYSIVKEDLTKRIKFFDDAITKLDTNIRYINNKEK